MESQVFILFTNEADYLLLSFFFSKRALLRANCFLIETKTLSLILCVSSSEILIKFSDVRGIFFSNTLAPASLILLFPRFTDVRGVLRARALAPSSPIALPYRYSDVSVVFWAKALAPSSPNLLYDRSSSSKAI